MMIRRFIMRILRRKTHLAFAAFELFGFTHRVAPCRSDRDRSMSAGRKAFRFMQFIDETRPFLGASHACAAWKN
jgi:hypothetical protein